MVHRLIAGELNHSIRKEMLCYTRTSRVARNIGNEVCLKIFRLVYSCVLELQMRLGGLLVFVAGQQCGDGQIFFSLEFMIPTCVYEFCCLCYVLDGSPANFCKSGVIVCRDDSRSWLYGKGFKIRLSYLIYFYFALLNCRS